MNTNLDDVTFAEFFGFRESRTSFSLDPDKDGDLLFGDSYREPFDNIYYSLQEKAFPGHGFKAVIWGDFGLGKTHMFRHLMYAINNPTAVSKPSIPILPYYIKCSSLAKKAPFSIFAGQLLKAIRTEDFGRMVKDYLILVEEGNAISIQEIAESEEEIAAAFDVIGQFPGKARYNCIRWLRGEKLSNPELANISDANDSGATISGQITSGKQLQIFQIISIISWKVENKILTFLIDEAERLRNITDTDNWETWLECLRNMLDIPYIGCIFSIGSITRDNLPGLLIDVELERRFTNNGYKELENLDTVDIRTFIQEMLERLIDVSSAIGAGSLSSGSFDPSLWPFSQDGFDAFITYCTDAPQGNKPSEMLHGLQQLAARAFRLRVPIIDEAIVNQVFEEIT